MMAPFARTGEAQAALAIRTKVRQDAVRTTTRTRPKPSHASPATPDLPGPHPRVAYLLRAAFFCSGAAALCYQVVWMRKLATFFGNTTLATSVCLTAFMAGLALGSYVIGRRAGEVRQPFRYYARLELFIGAYGLASLYLIDAVRAAYLALARHSPQLPLDSFPLVAFQFLSCFLVLLAPTAMMGGTLPMGVKGVVRRLDAVGREVAWLYGLNTLGAALGVLLVGFFVLPKIGLSGSVVAAALLNFAVYLAVFRRDSRDTPATAKTDSRSPMPKSPVALSRPLLVLLMVGFGLSGFAGLALEVVWSRALCLLTGSSIYAFSAVLFAVLVGIALGSVVTARLFARRPAGPAWFAGVEIGAGISTLALVAIYAHLPHVFQRMVVNHGGNASALLTDDVFVILAFLFVPTLLAGASFPILSRVCAQDEARLPRTIGSIYAANTAGCIAGAFAAGFLLIPNPHLGLRATALLCAALYVLSGAAVLAVGTRRARLAAGLSLAVLAAAILLLPSWRPASISVGVFDLRVAPRDIEDESVQKLVYYREGSSCTVSVFDEPRYDASNQPADGAAAPPSCRVLKVNGKVDASTLTVDATTQTLLAHLPLLLADRTDSVLVVGLGSGATAGGATLHPVKRVDCVEIEPAVAEAATYFLSINNGVLSDPRFHLHFADARTYLATSPVKYDVIISEPSNPWVAGVSSLFTVEHFQACRDSLADDGVICQWFHLYELGRDDVRSVIASFLKAFPDTTLWAADDKALDVLLIAKKHPWKVNYPRLAARLNRLPNVAEELRAADLDTPERLLSSLLRGPAGLQQIARGGLLNTDNFPRLEFSAPLYMNDDAVYQENVRLVKESEATTLDDWVDFGGPRSPDLRKALAEAILSRYLALEGLEPTLGLALAELTAASAQAPARADLCEDLERVKWLMSR